MVFWKRPKNENFEARNVVTDFIKHYVFNDFMKFKKLIFWINQKPQGYELFEVIKRVGDFKWFFKANLYKNSEAWNQWLKNSEAWYICFYKNEKKDTAILNDF